LGLLLERQGLLRSAAETFEKALSVCLRDTETHATMARTNLARVLCATGRNPEAIEQLKSLAEPSFVSQCILALAYFKGTLSLNIYLHCISEFFIFNIHSINYIGHIGYIL
jgi:hypothetical protein